MADTSKYTAYKNSYQKEKYDRIALQVKKGKKEDIRIYAESKGETLNGFINRLIDEAMQNEEP